MPAQPPAAGTHIVEVGEHTHTPAGVQGQLEARVAVHVREGTKWEGNLEVMWREHVHVDIDDAVVSANGILSCFARGYGPGDFTPAAAQMELSRSCKLAQKSPIFSLLSIVCEWCATWYSTWGQVAEGSDSDVKCFMPLRNKGTIGFPGS